MTAQTRVDARIEIGCLFGMVHASIVGDSYGAHVEVDGNVLADSGLRPLPEGDDWTVAAAIREVARAMVAKAHDETATPYPAAARQLNAASIAVSLPMPDSDIADRGSESVANCATLRT